MSANSNQTSSDNNEYGCRKCPGKVFKADEREEHYKFHGLSGKKTDFEDHIPNPKKKRFDGDKEAESNNAKMVAVSGMDGRGPVSYPTKIKYENLAGVRIKSKKYYDDGVTGTWVNGTGA